MRVRSGDHCAVGRPGLAAVVPGLYTKAEAVYGTSEMAVTLDDVLSRRTRARLFDRKPPEAAEMSPVDAAEMAGTRSSRDRSPTSATVRSGANRSADIEADLLGVNR
jgi:glycerol-3-phosphate dehydrogenase